MKTRKKSGKFKVPPYKPEVFTSLWPVKHCIQISAQFELVNNLAKLTLMAI